MTTETILDTAVRTVKYRIKVDELLWANRDKTKVRFLPDSLELRFVDGVLNLVSIHGPRVTSRGNVHASVRDVWNWPYQRPGKVEPAATLLDADPPEFVVKAVVELGYDPGTNMWARSAAP